MNEGGLANLFDKPDFSRVTLVKPTLCAKNPDRVIQKKEKGNYSTLFRSNFKAIHTLAKCLKELQSKSVLDYCSTRR